MSLGGAPSIPIAVSDGSDTEEEASAAPVPEVTEPSEEEDRDSRSLRIADPRLNNRDYDKVAPTPCSACGLCVCMCVLLRVCALVRVRERPSPPTPSRAGFVQLSEGFGVGYASPARNSVIVARCGRLELNRGDFRRLLDGCMLNDEVRGGARACGWGCDLHGRAVVGGCVTLWGRPGHQLHDCTVEDPVHRPCRETVCGSGEPVGVRCRECMCVCVSGCVSLCVWVCVPGSTCSTPSS